MSIQITRRATNVDIYVFIFGQLHPEYIGLTIADYIVTLLSR